MRVSLFSIADESPVDSGSEDSWGYPKHKTNINNVYKPISLLLTSTMYRRGFYVNIKENEVDDLPIVQTPMIKQALSTLSVNLNENGNAVERSSRQRTFTKRYDDYFPDRTPSTSALSPERSASSLTMNSSESSLPRKTRQVLTTSKKRKRQKITESPNKLSKSENLSTARIVDHHYRSPTYSITNAVSSDERFLAYWLEPTSLITEDAGFC
ncbi:unnamed protein product [Didymodactylos carnosus]|uniref:Uncharacterized protein n=1 Tax=Didymodactylos carnosus TaxID=1234261 RepID=A0A814U925_9BILA|nr:unnamed protein product [Didymodactylos carnosus]CAF1203172.1 unnamed protein product [Didymodactylos carnosus]CAF3937235.1 unnamed protein product [Didymodactylos carnosus]CAF4013017.1 unnamed protein product [Didymodactylos carnosus]